MKLDVICPIYWLDEKYFYDNIKSWFKELPINKLYLGNNNKNISFLDDMPSQITIIDQLQHKTLGKCLSELMKRVETEWFVYVHSDVFITPKAFSIMKEYMKDDVGIIESHREHWSGEYRSILKYDKHIQLPCHKSCNYYYRNRSFSGLQIMRKKAIESLIEKIEDDYVYRNEDMIFHYECVKNGYKYAKTWAMHIHQNINYDWTFNHKETHIMQFKGFVKYTEPNDITMFPCLMALKKLKREYEYSIQRALSDCYMLNSNWGEIIVEKWDDL